MPYIIVFSCILIALFIIRAAVGRLDPMPDLEVVSAQIIGQREINADVFEWAKGNGSTLLVLADGIGVGARGRTAALAATDSIVRTFELRELLTNPSFFFRLAFHNANEAVLRHIPDGTAGANAICALVSGNSLYYALAGNCKALVFRNGVLIPLSHGHTLDVLARNAFKKQEISREEARKVYHEHLVFNYIGKDDFRDLEMFDVPVRLKRGDCLVLMTDGVFDFCMLQDVEDILKTRQTCHSKVQNIMDLLKRNNDPHQDNATIVLAQVNRIY